MKNKTLFFFDEIKEMVKLLMKEKNKEFEKKIEMNQLFIGSLMKKNVRKETLFKS